MIDYSKWEVKAVSVNRLQLDPDNPRFATSFTRPTQQQLIAEMVEHEEVLDLARDIGRQGYFPNELLVAVKDGSRYIVVEGNRRLAALKLLQNPDLAPPASQKRVRQLSEKNAGAIEKVTVVIAPNRAAAVPLIIARHKGESIKKWTTIMQARFVQSRLAEGLNVDDVAEETGLERTEVIRQLRDSKLYDVIRSLPLATEARQIADDPRKFPFTTLRRLIESSAVHNALEIQTDEKHGFVTSLPRERFEKLLTAIVNDIATEKITSRTHNTAEEVSQYLKELLKKMDGSKPATKTVGTEKTPADDFIDLSKVQPTVHRKPKKAKSKASPPIGVMPKGFRIDVENDRISEIADELKRLRVDQYPNAVAITFRSLLDMSVSRYLTEKKEMKPLIAKLSQKGGPRPKDWSPTLAQQLNHILVTGTVPLGPEARKSLQKFLSDSKSSLTLDSLNWFAHNRYVPPTVEQMRAFWTMLTPLFELTLQKES